MVRFGETLDFSGDSPLDESRLLSGECLDCLEAVLESGLSGDDLTDVDGLSLMSPRAMASSRGSSLPVSG